MIPTKIPTNQQNNQKYIPNFFHITRKADESGVSGIGKVLEGCVFSDGTTVIRWCVEGKPNSTAIYPSFQDFKFIHIDSHPTNGTEIIWNS